MKLEEQLVEKEAELVKLKADVETFRTCEEWLAAQAIHVKRSEELSRVRHAVHEAEKARLNELLGVEEAPEVHDEDEEDDYDKDGAHESAFEQRNEASRALLARWCGLTEDDVAEGRDHHGEKSLLDESRAVIRNLLEEAAETDAIRKLKAKQEKAEELQSLARNAESEMRSGGIPGIVDGQTLWRMERLLGQTDTAVREIRGKIWKRDSAKQEREAEHERKAVPSAEALAAEKAADKRGIAARKRLRSLTGFGSRNSYRMHHSGGERTKERQSLLDFLKKELSL